MIMYRTTGINIRMDLASTGTYFRSYYPHTVLDTGGRLGIPTYRGVPGLPLTYLRG